MKKGSPVFGVTAVTTLTRRKTGRSALWADLFAGSIMTRYVVSESRQTSKFIEAAICCCKIDSAVDVSQDEVFE